VPASNSDDPVEIHLQDKLETKEVVVLISSVT
jgi:hypothetical protein